MGMRMVFYFRNGERADAYENDPEHSWCKKDDTEPTANTPVLLVVPGSCLIYLVKRQLNQQRFTL
jgi:hypothetical protein